MPHSCYEEKKYIYWGTFWELPKSRKYQFIREGLGWIINLFFLFFPFLLVIKVVSEIGDKNVDRVNSGKISVLEGEQADESMVSGTTVSVFW